MLRIDRSSTQPYPLRMQSQTIVITGTSRGIGLALTRRFAKRGDHVYALLRDPRAELLTAAIRENPDRITAIGADVTDPASLASAAQNVAELAPQGIDVLINNAGILLTRETPDPRQFDINQLEETIRVNTIGPLRVVQAFLDVLERRTQTIEAPGNDRHPLVVNTSSIMGSISGVGGRRDYSYSVSKAALNMLGRILSFDLAELGIDSFLIHPGWVRTDMGGANAQYDQEESAEGIIRQIEEWRPGDAPFLDFQGNPLAW